MQDDEREIRQLVATWLNATTAGDIETVLSLMTEDVVFLLPGKPVMRKADFASAAAAQSGPAAPVIEGNSEIREIVVLGEWAFLWTKLTVIATPPDGSPETHAGHTLSVLRKVHGKWRLARDANLLAPLPPPEP
ncbi:MAG TPA: SgcJ/EcaC family oxidoreductase [Rhodanobacteraceae bacterium]|nr:SgcJ/EcaC family oxidoreductase [Rhodanobacteraceae bacterium]